MADTRDITTEEEEEEVRGGEKLEGGGRKRLMGRMWKIPRLKEKEESWRYLLLLASRGEKRRCQE